jgi:hypothetical protein
MADQHSSPSAEKSETGLSALIRYFNGSSVRRSALGYLFGDIPVLLSGIFGRNQSKILAGIAGIFQTVFYAIDKAGDPLKLDGLLDLLDNKITEASAREDGAILPLDAPAPKQGVEKMVDVSRTFGQEIGSGLMVVQGVSMLSSSMHYTNADSSKAKIIWGEFANGALNIIAFGTAALSTLVQKLGYKFPERKHKDLPNLHPVSIADRIRSEPSTISAPLAMSSSLAGVGAGVQLLAQGKRAAGFSQTLGSVGYLFAEANLGGFSGDEKKKHTLCLVDQAGKEVDTAALYKPAVEKLIAGGRLKQGQNNDATLRDVAGLFASATGMNEKKRGSLADEIFLQLAEHVPAAYQPQKVAA